MGLCWAILALSWAILAPCWAILALSWPILALCWPILAYLGPMLAYLGPLDLQFCPSWPNLAPTWPQLGPTWSNLDPTWPSLGPNLGFLVDFEGHVRSQNRQNFNIYRKMGKSFSQEHDHCQIAMSIFCETERIPMHSSAQRLGGHACEHFPDI